ncbi:MAG: hypothetical protein LUH15_20825 [Tannerellaceae bacterium]|nr:hypothetical protein [Tannerellaceae bacterium]
MISCVIILLIVSVLLVTAYILKGKQFLSRLKKPILKVNTRDLVFKTLTELNCSPTYEEQGFIKFIYKDIPFYVEAVEDNAIIKILSLHESDISHIKDRKVLHWITHNVNKNNHFKVIPYRIEENSLHFSVCASILFIKQIPQIKGYLIALLEQCFKIKDEMQDMIHGDEVISPLSTDRVKIKGFSMQ